MAFDPRLLRGFVVLAEELSFARAAARLDLAQPALSQQLQRLEEQLGVRLFERSTRRVALTEPGEAFLPHARDALRAAEQAEAAARSLADGRAGRLRLSLDVDVPETVRESINRFQRANPAIDLRVSLKDYPDGLLDLHAGVVDAVMGWEGSPDARLLVTPVAPVAIRAAVNRRHPEAGATQITRSTFRRSPVALFPRALGPESYDVLVAAVAEGTEDEVLVHEVHNTADSVGAMLAAVAADDALVSFITPGYLERHTVPEIAALDFDPPLHIELVLFHLSERPVLTRLRASLRDDLAEAAAPR